MQSRFKQSAFLRFLNPILDFCLHPSLAHLDAKFDLKKNEKLFCLVVNERFGEAIGYVIAELLSPFLFTFSKDLYALSYQSVTFFLLDKSLGVFFYSCQLLMPFFCIQSLNLQQLNLPDEILFEKSTNKTNIYCIRQNILPDQIYSTHFHIVNIYNFWYRNSNMDFEFYKMFYFGMQCMKT